MSHMSHHRRRRLERALIRHENLYAIYDAGQGHRFKSEKVYKSTMAELTKVIDRTRANL